MRGQVCDGAALDTMLAGTCAQVAVWNAEAAKPQ
jgi:hypothetical protein